MIQVACNPDPSNKSLGTRCERLRRKGLMFLADVLKLRKFRSLSGSMRIDEPQRNNANVIDAGYHRHHPHQQHHHHHRHQGLTLLSRSNPVGMTGTDSWRREGDNASEPTSGSSLASSTTTAGDDRLGNAPSSLSCCSDHTTGGMMIEDDNDASPAHSIVTLTPGRTRNIDQDMEALRLSRQDNPFLQVLASKESLIDPTDESESDDAILMSQELGETDPLTLAQVHEHLVRSPPPVSWTRGPVFQFFPQHQQLESPSCRSEPSARCRTASPRPTCGNDHEDARDRHSHTFSLLNPTPIRSLSEVRRLHRSTEDSVQLMSSE
ncbi:uncharacterized protein LOC106649003 isoform X1 [Trichogramma pretiosum]|uniref:uncharacterized protein LOC106649003 isoform X1 n=2 Tax=Trichogramma pretiosum TaxID=7493 RepID=UPI0006C9C1DB|nr:uncharacterized protein LOC106649003 isoform X1 [Trichogramma pretiosum]